MSENEEYTTIKLPSKVYKKIENAVVALYKKLKITKVPIDPFMIASQLGYIVKKYSSLPRKVQIELKTREKEGLSHYDPDLGTFVIYYDDSISYARVRFTIMHEIGTFFSDIVKRAFWRKRWPTILPHMRLPRLRLWVTISAKIIWMLPTSSTYHRNVQISVFSGFPIGRTIAAK